MGTARTENISTKYVFSSLTCYACEYIEVQRIESTQKLRLSDSIVPREPSLNSNKPLARIITAPTINSALQNLFNGILSLMIHSFACSETALLFNSHESRRFKNIERVARRKLLHCMRPHYYRIYVFLPETNWRH